MVPAALGIGELAQLQQGGALIELEPFLELT
jgi:hypothetical protein